MPGHAFPLSHEAEPTQMDDKGCYCIRSAIAALVIPIATGKTSTLTFRIEPGLKEALCTVAKGEHCSVANMVEVMILLHPPTHRA
jgi:hypothetical protein